VKRELYPEKWEQQQAKRREVMRKKTEEAIRAQQAKRQHQARLERALKEGEDKEDKQGQYVRRGSSGRFFMLTEHEEELVERILQDTDDAELEATGMELGLADPHGFAFTMDTANNLQQIEGKLSLLAQDHLFDEAGSMIDFRSKRASEMASQSSASVHRPFSASTRLTAGGSGSSRADTESVASGKVAPSVPGSEARSWRAGGGAPSENGGRNDESVSAPRSERVVQDYLTQQRLAKEAARREKELDSRIRQLRTSEIPLPSKLAAGEIESLIKHCKQAHEAYEARVDAINRMPTPSLRGSHDQLLLPGSPVSQSSPADDGTLLANHPGTCADAREGVPSSRVAAPPTSSSADPHRPSSVDRPLSGRRSRPSSSGDRPPSAGRPPSSPSARRPSSTAGPTRPARERQRQPRDASSVADVIGADARAPRLVLHATPKEPQPAPRSGRRARDSGSDRAAGVTTGPIPVRREVQPALTLDGDGKLRRVPSAGRRAGIPVPHTPS